MQSHVRFVVWIVSVLGVDSRPASGEGIHNRSEILETACFLEESLGIRIVFVEEVRP